MIATTNPETRTYNIGFADGARRMKHELAIENSRVQSENGKLKTENEALRTRNEKL